MLQKHVEPYVLDSDSVTIIIPAQREMDCSKSHWISVIDDKFITNRRPRIGAVIARPLRNYCQIGRWIWWISFKCLVFEIWVRKYPHANRRIHQIIDTMLEYCLFVGSTKLVRTKRTLIFQRGFRVCLFGKKAAYWILTFAAKIRAIWLPFFEKNVSLWFQNHGRL